MSCDLISEQVVKEIFNVKAGTINIGEAKDPEILSPVLAF